MDTQPSQIQVLESHLKMFMLVVPKAAQNKAKSILDLHEFGVLQSPTAAGTEAWGIFVKKKSMDLKVCNLLSDLNVGRE